MKDIYNNEYEVKIVDKIAKIYHYGKLLEEGPFIEEKIFPRDGSGWVTKKEILKDGIWKTYDTNGNVIKETTYVRGKIK